MDVAFLPVSTWDPGLIQAFGDHYTGSKGHPPGKKLAWRIFTAGRDRGWIVLGEPAFKLSPRRRLGLVGARPVDATVCCALYRVDGRRAGEPAASDILREWHAVASDEWRTRYGWAPVHWETMVSPSDVACDVPGACFRRAGYRSLGMTTGWGARRPPGHSRGPRVWCETAPKLVLYRGPLARIEVC
jgi:hypothetical protein